MPNTHQSARKLLSATELELFNTGRRGAIETLGIGQLRVKAGRTRRLRDKYRDLFRRQRITTRERTGSKRGPRGVSNLRTREKGALFGELLARFEKRIAQLETAARSRPAMPKKAHRAAPGRGAPSARKAPPASGPVSRGGFVSGAARGAATKHRAQNSRRIAIHGHLGSRTRRHQAKRDRRR
jgi:hypothetical protein